MYVAANNPKYFCRKCRNKIPIVDLENIVRQELKVFFGQTERIASHLAEADQNLTEKSALLDTHHREIQKVKESMHQTHELYLNKQISGDGFRGLYAPAAERMKPLQAELPRLEAEVDFLKVNKLSADDVLREAGSLYEKWPMLPTDDKRKIIEALVEEVTIGNGEIDITYSHVPTSIEQCKNQQKLVALLGIAQRTIRVNFAVKPKKYSKFNPLPVNIKTIGDLICVRRQTKNLTPGHLASKMGIASSVVSSWEDGNARPNDWQLELLAKILGFDPKDMEAMRPKP